MSSRAAPPISTFVGRAAELEVLRTSLARGARLISIVGPPGIGKTRLLREFVDTADLEFQSTFIEVVEVRSPDALRAALADGLGFRDAQPSDGEAFAAQVARAVDDRGPTVLALDGFDAALEAAPLLLQWLGAAPDLAFVVTSRAWLQIEGERRIELAPLEVPGPEAFGEALRSSDAVRLLLDRAGLLPDEMTLSALADVARRLEGLPLAIELYAAQFATGDLALLENDSSPAVPRHSRADEELGVRSTLNAAFERSWSNLTADERRVFAGASVFRGGFDRKAAAHVLDARERSGGDGQGAAVLLSLRKKSLLVDMVTAAPGSRYRMLEAVRRFAEEKLGDSPDSRELRERHAAYYLAQTLELSPLANGEQASEVRARLAEDTLNALAAVTAFRALGDARATSRLLLALFPVLGRGSRSLDYRERLAEALRVLPDDDPLRVEIRATLATLLLLAGDRARGVRELGKTREEGDRLGRPDLADEARAKLALFDPGDTPPTDADATDLRLVTLERLAEQTTARGAVLGQILAHLARVFHLAARPRMSIELLGRASKAFLEAGSLVDDAIVRLHLASMFVATGRFEEALRHVRSVLRLADSVDDCEIRRRALPCLARAELACGNADAALAAAEQGIELHRFLGDGWSEGYALAGLADIMLFDGRCSDAVRVYREAIARLIEHGEMGLVGASLARIAVAQASLGDGSLAHETFARARASIEASERRDLLAPAEISYGHLLLQAGDRDAAERCLEIAARLNAEGRPIGETRDEVRYAVRLLARALTRASALAGDAALAPDWIVSRDGSWFERQSQARVALPRRPSERRILAYLVEQHLSAPGHPITRDDLFRAGWGEERIRPASAKNRVNVALAHLRQSGLRPLLKSQSEGVLIDADARVAWDPLEP